MKPGMRLKMEFLYYFKERNLPFTVCEETMIHSNNEVRTFLILPSASMEMLVIQRAIQITTLFQAPANR